MSAHVSLQDVSIRYGKICAVEHVSGVFTRGSLTAVAGPNGAGKSSLLKAILGLVRPSAGQITVDEADPADIAYLPQASAVARDFPMSVLDAAETGYWPRLGHSKPLTPALRSRAKNVLEQVGLSDLLDRRISDLSGGQFQRLLFARVMVQDAPLILLDEPFASIDAETTGRLMQLILDWHKEGRTIICVLHDLLLIRKYFPESFVLAGKCLGHGHTHLLLEEKLLSFDLDMAEICAGPDSKEHKNHV